MKYVDGASIVLLNKNRTQVFLVFRSDYPIWSVTGGGIEQNEKPEQAAIREAYEETSFKVKIIRKIGIYKYPTRVTHLFEGKVVAGNFKPEFMGCKGKWFRVNDLPIDITSGGKQLVKDTVNYSGPEFVKSGKEVNIFNNLHLIIRHPMATIKFLFR